MRATIASAPSFMGYLFYRQGLQNFPVKKSATADAATASGLSTGLSPCART
ncbi:hypothetical protein HG1285_17090 [Hydrogenivirga sp. 128-5-R1-1]|nr:hypothetical protein HG1285_17090 [Hydrogenivirga sp. 128-5-R1-1]